MKDPQHHIRTEMAMAMGLSDKPLNATTLAEEVAHSLGFDEWLDDPDHEVWDIALEFFND